MCAFANEVVRSSFSFFKILGQPDAMSRPPIALGAKGRVSESPDVRY
jgi:hypothetical protein